jgi:hypothetical protein
MKGDLALKINLVYFFFEMLIRVECVYVCFI